MRGAEVVSSQRLCDCDLRGSVLMTFCRLLERVEVDGTKGNGDGKGATEVEKREEHAP